jgi:hypothetical protein
MRNTLFHLLIIFSLCASCFGEGEELRTVVSQGFPHTGDVRVLCWVTPVDGEGFVSQIIVFRVERTGPATILWQSSLDPAYSPQIRFVEEITAGGLPIALVERQNGAATSQLDIIGQISGHFQQIGQLDGFKFDVEHLGESKLPFIIAHRDGNTLDIPVIYRWNGSRLVDDSASHPAYYGRLLSEDKANLPQNSSGIVLINLSKIAALSGDRTEARKILNSALSTERAKGNAANKETVGLIEEALQGLERDVPQ